jgi:Family of unknown function (DUF5305)
MKLPHPNLDSDDNLLVALGILGGVATALVVLAAYAFVLPKVQTETQTLASYEHTGNFRYTVTAQPSALNPSGTIGPVLPGSDAGDATTREPIFTRLAQVLDFSYVYQLQGASDVTGTMTADLVIRAGDNWSDTMNLVPITPFKGATGALQGSVDFNQIAGLLTQLEEQTGVRAESVDLVITPVVKVQARANGQQINETYSSPLTLAYTSTLITPDATLSFSEPKTITNTTRFDKELGLFGSTISVTSVRPIATLLALITLVPTVLLAAVYFLGFGRSEAGMARARYRSIVVPVSEVASLVNHRIAVASIQDLAQMAKREGRSLFVCDFENGSQAYLVHDGMVIYHYTIGNVPEGWIKTPGKITASSALVGHGNEPAASEVEAAEPLAAASEEEALEPPTVVSEMEAMEPSESASEVEAVEPLAVIEAAPPTIDEDVIPEWLSALPESEEAEGELSSSNGHGFGMHEPALFAPLTLESEIAPERNALPVEEAFTERPKSEVDRPETLKSDTVALDRTETSEWTDVPSGSENALGIEFVSDADSSEIEEDAAAVERLNLDGASEADGPESEAEITVPGDQIGTDAPQENETSSSAEEKDKLEISMSSERPHQEQQKGSKEPAYVRHDLEPMTVSHRAVSPHSSVRNWLRKRSGGPLSDRERVEERLGLARRQAVPAQETDEPTQNDDDFGPVEQTQVSTVREQPGPDLEEPVPDELKDSSQPSDASDKDEAEISENNQRLQGMDTSVQGNPSSVLLDSPPEASTAPALHPDSVGDFLIADQGIVATFEEASLIEQEADFATATTASSDDLREDNSGAAREEAGAETDEGAAAEPAIEVKPPVSSEVRRRQSQDVSLEQKLTAQARKWLRDLLE